MQVQQDAINSSGSVLLAAILTAHTLSSGLDLGLQDIEGKACSRILHNTAQHEQRHSTA
jgi:hypothetical protein